MLFYQTAERPIIFIGINKLIILGSKYTVQDYKSCLIIYKRETEACIQISNPQSIGFIHAVLANTEVLIPTTLSQIILDLYEISIFPCTR